MIRFVDGDVTIQNRNTSITLGNEEKEYHGVSERDEATGDLTITVDFEVPENGTPVKLVLHNENDATFLGQFRIDEADGSLPNTTSLNK